jgi:hypothetical protein
LKIFYASLLSIEVGYFLLRAYARSHWSGGDYSYNLVRLPFNIVGNLLGYGGVLAVGTPFVEWYFQARFFFRQNLLLATFLSLVCMGVVLLVVRLVWKKRKEQWVGLVAWCLLFFVITLAPFLGLGGLAERYLYLSSFSIFLLLSYAVFALGVRIENYTEAVADYTAYGLLVGFFAVFLMFSLVRDQQDWHLASQYVENRMHEFKTRCSTFTPSELLVRISPPNRIGRAWVFQVGYEEGANLCCDKNLRIQRK